MSSFKDYIALFLILVGLIVLSKIFITICQLWFNIEIDEHTIGFAVGMIFKDFYYDKKLSKLKRPLIPKARIRIPSIRPSQIRVPPQKIQYQQLPKTVQHYKPVPEKYEIELGKLNAYVNDPKVNSIECSGKI